MTIEKEEGTHTVQGSTKDILQSILILLAGAGTARLIAFAATPAITRMYSPTDFGLMALYASVITLISPILALRYMGAIPLPKSDSAAANIAALSALLILVNGTAVALILLLGLDTVFSSTPAAQLSGYIWLLCLGLFGSAYYELATMWATRKKNFKAIAKSTVTQAVLSAGTKLCMGLLEFKPSGLLVGQAFQISGGVVGLLAQFKSDIQKQARHISVKRLKTSLLRYRSFPIYRLPVALILPLTMQAPILATSNWFSIATAGQLGLAISASALPASLIGNSTRQAYFGQIARLGTKNSVAVYGITKEILARLCALSTVPAIVLIFWGPPLFEITFGSEWQEAGAFAQALTPMLICQFISTPFTGALDLYNKQSLLLRLSIFRLMITLASLTFSYQLGLQATQLLLMYSIAGGLSHLIGLCCVLHLLRSRSLQESRPT